MSEKFNFFEGMKLSQLNEEDRKAFLSDLNLPTTKQLMYYHWEGVVPYLVDDVVVEKVFDNGFLTLRLKLRNSDYEPLMNNMHFVEMNKGEEAVRKMFNK